MALFLGTAGFIVLQKGMENKPIIFLKTFVLMNLEVVLSFAHKNNIQKPPKNMPK